MNLISTVWHSGTHSLLATLEGESIWRHCSPEAIEMAKSGEYEVYTTSRDTYRVAASWINRGRWGSKPWEKRWRAQWEAYKEIKKIATVVPMEELSYRYNDHADNSGAHRLLDEGKVDEFHKLYGKRLLTFALRCAK